MREEIGILLSRLGFRDFGPDMQTGAGVFRSWREGLKISEEYRDLAITS